MQTSPKKNHQKEEIEKTTDEEPTITIRERKNPSTNHRTGLCKSNREHENDMD